MYHIQKLSKDDKVMSAENNLNETDVKKRKLEEVHQNSSGYGNQGFLRLCKTNSAKGWFLDGDVNSFNELGKYL